MDHFLKRFTVIDFLSMFMPGGVLILALNYYMGGMTEPVCQFFGNQILFIAVYFVAISYLSGMLLQEVSKFLEKFLIRKLDTVHNEWLSIPQMDIYYRAAFGRTIEQAKSQYGTPKLGRQIYLYVSDPEISGSKLSLFHAFYSMSRNGFIASLLIFVISTLDQVSQDFFSIDGLMVPTFSLFFAFTMLLRSMRFYRITQERAYRDFLKLGEKEDHHISHSVRDDLSSE